MKIITLRVDEAMHRKMKKDKEAKGIENWEKYINYLFYGTKRNIQKLKGGGKKWLNTRI